jgi:hypothetical protein
MLFTVAKCATFVTNRLKGEYFVNKSFGNRLKRILLLSSFVRHLQQKFIHSYNLLIDIDNTNIL